MSQRFYINVDSIQEKIAIGEVIFFYNESNSKWNNKMKSKFIETVLFNIPSADIVFVYRDNKYIIIDGNNRISTLLEYKSNDLKLDNNVYMLWKNKTFLKLDSSEALRFNNYLLSVIVSEVPPTMDLKLFKSCYYM